MSPRSSREARRELSPHDRIGRWRGQEHRPRDPPAQHASRPANRNPGRHETGKPGKQPLQADLAFSPRQRGTDTVVATAGEGEVPPGIASGDVERVRIGEDAGIAVRGGQDGGDRLAGVDRLPRELDGPAAYPGRELNRGFQPEDLVDRIRPHTWIRLEDVELVRM